MTHGDTNAAVPTADSAAQAHTHAAQSPTAQFADAQSPDAQLSDTQSAAAEFSAVQSPTSEQSTSAHPLGDGDYANRDGANGGGQGTQMTDCAGFVEMACAAADGADGYSKARAGNASDAQAGAAISPGVDVAHDVWAGVAPPEATERLESATTSLPTAKTAEAAKTVEAPSPSPETFVASVIGGTVAPAQDAGASSGPADDLSDEAAAYKMIDLEDDGDAIDDSIDDSMEPRITTETHRAAPTTSGMWTIPILCMGLAMIASCWLLPLAEENRQMVYDRERLKVDLQQIKDQVAVNDEFLRRAAVDSTLAQRLAQREMKVIRKGMSILDLDSATGEEDMSPFTLVSLPPAPPLPPYHPLGGWLATVCLSPRPRLFLTGAGLMLVAAGLVLGASPETEDEEPLEEPAGSEYLRAA